MTVHSLWNSAAATIAAIPERGLLLVVASGLVGAVVGSQLARRGSGFGRGLRAVSTLALAAVLVTVVLQLSRFDPRLEVAMPDAVLPEQVVEGGETRIPMAGDGHFWLRAELNGVPANFLVDTGATLTAVTSDLAAEAGLRPRRGGLPIALNTANGPISAQLASAESIRFGNVDARGLDVVISPRLGETNMIGMNLLSRLKSWRVEGDVMVLVPNNPQPPIPQR